MAEGHKIWRKCPWCDGTGQRIITEGDDPIEQVEDDCPYCDATGALFWGWMSKDDETIPDSRQEP